MDDFIRNYDVKVKIVMENVSVLMSIYNTKGADSLEEKNSQNDRNYNKPD